MDFATGEQVERLIAKTIKQSGKEPGKTYREVLRDRLLVRLFSEGCERFALKGGSGMLARIPDARATRDIDLISTSEESVEQVMADFERLIARDMGDLFRFEVEGFEEALDDNGYARLLKIKCLTFIGAAEKDPVMIDLSLDGEMTDLPVFIVPLNRIEIPGFATADYLVYPLVDQVADKLCAMVELHNGYPSSRVKDLVDVMLVLAHEDVNCVRMRRALATEAEKRGLAPLKAVEPPSFWRSLYPAQAKKTALPQDFVNFDFAVTLLAAFTKPLVGEGDFSIWNHHELQWE